MPVFESRRKVQALGSSLALTLPAFFVKANEVEKGSEAKVFFGLEGVLVVSWIEDPEALRKNLMAIMDKLEEKAMNRKVEGGKGDA